VVPRVAAAVVVREPRHLDQEIEKEANR
jgi:hypothetical protein